VITPWDLSDLIQHQFQLFGWLDDHPELREAEPALFPEDDHHEMTIAGERWSCSVDRRELAFTQRDTGISVLLHKRQRSPFEFSGRGLLHFLLSRDERSRLNDILVDNWIVKMGSAGKVKPSDYTPDFWSVH